MAAQSRKKSKRLLLDEHQATIRAYHTAGMPYKAIVEKMAKGGCVATLRDYNRAFKRWNLSKLHKHPKPAVPTALLSRADLHQHLVWSRVEIIYDKPIELSRPQALHYVGCKNGYELMRQAMQENNLLRYNAAVHRTLDHFSYLVLDKSTNLMPLILFVAVHSLRPHGADTTRFDLPAFVRMAWRIVKTSLGEGHPYTDVLSTICTTAGQNQTCLVALQKCATILRQAGLVSLVEEVETILCDTYRVLGRLAEASIMSRGILRQRQTSYASPFHTKIVVATNTLANCLLYSGQSQEARRVLESLVPRDQESTIGPRHSPDVLYFESRRLAAIAAYISGDVNDASMIVCQSIQELSLRDHGAMGEDLNSTEFECVARSAARSLQQCGLRFAGQMLQEMTTIALSSLRQPYHQNEVRYAMRHLSQTTAILMTCGEVV